MPKVFSYVIFCILTFPLGFCIMNIYNYKEANTLKKLFLCLFLICAMLFCSFSVFGEESGEVSDIIAPESGEPAVYPSSKAVIYNPQTGTFVYDHKGDSRTEAATSAKMTALILIYDEFSTRLDNVITVKAEHLKNIGAATNPATPMIGIKAGNSFKIEELIKAACVSWANDAVNPLIHAYCEETGVSYDDFADKMTEYAESIGCSDTRYKEPLGRGDMGNTTTARDVALICAQFYNRYDLFISSAAGYYVLQGSTIHSRNYLLSERIMPGNYLRGARGFFAGQAFASGNYCIATSVEDGPLTYIVVVLDGCMYLYDEEGVRYFDEGKNPYTDIKTLVEWAKSRFSYINICLEGDAVDEILLEQGRNTDHLVVCTKNKIQTIGRIEDDLSGLEVKITYDTERVYTVTDKNGKSQYAIKAPVTKGETLGMAEFILNGAVIGSTPLLAADNVDTDTVVKFFETVESMLFSSTAKTVLTVVGVLIGLYVLYCLAAFAVRVVKKVKKDVTDTKNEQKLKELKARREKKE